MSNLYLHREVREKGGAYGAGARAGHNSFDMTSYRDPHATQTLQSFENAAQWAAEPNNYTDAVRFCAMLSALKRLTDTNLPNRIWTRRSCLCSSKWMHQ